MTKEMTSSAARAAILAGKAPDGLSVGGYLDLGGCTGLTALPDGLSVGGSLDLRGCTGLTALPDGLSVGGSLYLGRCTGLTALPDGLSVGGYLYLGRCTGLTALPDGLSVGGSLDLRGCTGLTALPDGLSVGGYLDLGGCTGLTAPFEHAGIAYLAWDDEYTLRYHDDDGRYRAGCRDFTRAEALAHWEQSRPDNKARAALFLAAIKGHEPDGKE